MSTADGGAERTSHTYDAFLSYARADGVFAQQVSEALLARDKSTWMDVANRAPVEEWYPRVEQAIEASESFIFLITKSSLSSEECRRELAHAESRGKKIIPVLREDGARASTRMIESLACREWIVLRDCDDLVVGIDELVSAIEHDLQWSRDHTRLVMLAAEWERAGRDSGLLLRGSPLAVFAAYLRANERPVEPVVTSAHVEYIEASQRARRRRAVLGAATGVGGAVTVGTLGMVSKRLGANLAASRGSVGLLSDYVRDPGAVSPGTKNLVERLIAPAGRLPGVTARQLFDHALGDPGSRSRPAAEWNRLIETAGLDPAEAWRRIRRAQGL